MYVDPTTAFGLLVASGAFATAGAIVGTPQKQAAAGALLGMLLGPLGVIIVAALGANPTERRRRILERERVDAEWAERAQRAKQ